MLDVVEVMKLTNLLSLAIGTMLCTTAWFAFHGWVAKRYDFIAYAGKIDAWAQENRHSLSWASVLGVGLLCSAHQQHIEQVKENLRHQDFEVAIEKLPHSLLWTRESLRNEITKKAIQEQRYDVLVRAFECAYCPQSVLIYADKMNDAEASKLYHEAIKQNESVETFLQSIDHPDVSLLKLLATISLSRNWKDCEEWTEVGGLCQLAKQEKAAAAAYRYGEEAAKRRHDRAVAEGKLKE